VALRNEYDRLRFALEDMSTPTPQSEQTLALNSNAPSRGPTRESRQRSGAAATDEDRAEDWISHIGLDLYSDVRDLFETYSTIGNAFRSDQMKLS
jgi:hypothetical protein